jgi:predicted nucleotidyltransferase
VSIANEREKDLKLDLDAVANKDHQMVSNTAILTTISDFLACKPELELAILIGSRANGSARPDSDWDIAIQWVRGAGFLTQLAETETLRRELAKLLNISEDSVDLIDLPAARLAIRAVVAEEGLLLKGSNTLAWSRLL